MCVCEYVSNPYGVVCTYVCSLCRLGKPDVVPSSCMQTGVNRYGMKRAIRDCCCAAASSPRHASLQRLPPNLGVRYVMAHPSAANLPVKEFGRAVHSADAVEYHLKEARHRSLLLRSLLGIGKGRTLPVAATGYQPPYHLPCSCITVSPPSLRLSYCPYLLPLPTAYSRLSSAYLLRFASCQQPATGWHLPITTYH